MVHGVGPGSVLGGRYAVTLRMSEGPGHERWRASDHTLERDVVLVCFPADSSVTPAVMDAARRAAGVEDPRLVRVLDVGSDGDVAFIVEEPLVGAVPMTHLLQSGGLPAAEVRRLVGEAASALDKARHRGLHHLALTPAAVLRMPDGEVKVRGLATEAALTDTDRLSEDRACRADAVGLVKVAYAGLTGRWPTAVAERRRPAQNVGLEAAPNVIGGVAAPSEIAVGVPNDLDLICRMTLNEDRGPISPGELALQIAPWPSEGPVTDGATGIGFSPVSDDNQPTRVLPAVPAAGAAATAASAAAGMDDSTMRIDSGRPVGPVTGAGVAAAVRSSAGTGAGTAAGHAEGERTAATSLAAAGAAAAGVAGAIGDKVGSFARAAADKAAAKAAERRAHQDDDFEGEDIHLSDALDEAPTGELEPPLPVFGHAAPEEPSGAQSRIALAIVGALVVVALVIGINNVLKIGEHDGPAQARPTVTVTASTPAASSSAPATSTEPPPTTTAPPPGVPVAIVGGKGFDPQEDNSEADQNVPQTFDGNPATGWRSRWTGTDNFNGKKSGVGVILDLGAPATITEVTLTLPAAQDVTVYAANADSLDGAQTVGTQTGANGTVTIKAAGPLQPATKLIVWITRTAPAEAPNHYRAQINEVAVR